MFTGDSYHDDTRDLTPSDESGTETGPTTERRKSRNKKWRRLNCDSKSVVEVTLDTKTGVDPREKTEDDHYPLPQGKPVKLSPPLPTVEEETIA